MMTANIHSEKTSSSCGNKLRYGIRFGRPDARKRRELTGGQQHESRMISLVGSDAPPGAVRVGDLSRGIFAASRPHSAKAGARW